MINSSFSVSAINAFNDNYIWAIEANTSDQVALVDPGCAAPCLAYLKQNNRQLSAILITHHHADHTGGIAELLNYCQQQGYTCPVYGPANEQIAALTIRLKHDDHIQLFGELDFSVIEVPGHTAGHIAYVNDQALFCGDTLFSGGCGRLFEGTAAQMHHSLKQLSALPKHTKVYCAHEYTLANLAFALSIEPNNSALQQYQQHAQQLRNAAQATIPSSIELEQQINPFLRSNQASVQQQVEQITGKKLSSSEQVFTELRKLKDVF